MPRPSLSPRPAPLLLLLAACATAKPADDTGGAGSPDPVDADGDGWVAADDCDDHDAGIHPEAVEICNEVDDDCDDAVDEDVLLTFFADADRDGWGSAAAAVAACAAPAGTVADDTDCDDGDATIHPEAEEVCDAVDNDCDGEVDEGVLRTFYADTDLDGHGDAGAPTEACSAPAGSVETGDDCDDTDPDAWPGNPEVCDEADNDCDGDVDEGVTTTWYQDRDGDGWGDGSAPSEACARPGGYAADPGDCDDTDAAVSPDAPEVCDGVDDDCDGDTDDDDADLDVSTASSWYADTDGDGYGDGAVAVSACSAPSGTVADDTDCDDTDASVNPGASEVCDGSVDDDCDGTVDEDVLGDGAACPASDCLDLLTTRPGAPDGVYWIDGTGTAMQVTCDMTEDGGGWTLVGSFVWPGDTGGVAGWTSGAAVGSTTWDQTRAFKLSDADINTLVGVKYRAQGTATTCWTSGGTAACSVDVTLFWSAGCTYDSGAASTGVCAVAYTDDNLATPTGTTSPCAWHYGLTSCDCGSTSTMGTSHQGDHVFVGELTGSSHAYDGRASEDPELTIWVR